MYHPVRHLYIHIPFCPHICPYCSFHVLPAYRKGAERLIDFLILEHQSVVKNLNPETIFLGGGTPTALSSEMLNHLLSYFILHDSPIPVEVTLECNPSTLSAKKAEVLLQHGANRLSIGAQSLDQAILKTLGRTHSVQAIFQCMDTARAAGFSNINLDLIFGVPGQTLQSWTQTLEAALELRPQHLSCYGLTYEEDTDFFARRRRGELKNDSDLENRMFDLADQILTDAGFRHYEISNYALPGYECRHNLAYWAGKDYYGIGPSAVSTVGGIRYRNGVFHEDGWSRVEEEHLTVETLASEYMALGLRTSRGIHEVDFVSRFGFAPCDQWGHEIRFLVQKGLLILQPNLHLTRRGREIADEVATYFV